MNATTVGLDTFNDVARPDHDGPVATPDEEGVVEMDSRRGQPRTPAKKTSGQKATPAKKATATPAKKTPAGPAKKTPAKATPTPTQAAPRNVAELLARLPLAGQDIPEEDKGPRSFHISRHWLERARAAVYWLAQVGVNEPTNVSELADLALRREVRRLEETYNDGEPFRAVQGKMKTGPGAEGVARLSEYQDRRRESRRGPGGEGGHGG